MPEAIFANHVRVLKITYVLDKVLRQLFLNRLHVVVDIRSLRTHSIFLKKAILSN